MQKHNETGRHSFLMGPGSGLGSGGDGGSLTKEIWDASKDSKGRKGDKEKEDFPGGGQHLGKHLEVNCRVRLQNSPGTIND